MPLETDIKAAIRDVSNFPKQGILFKDVSPIFADQTLCNNIVNGFMEKMSSKPDAVVGIESRGFLLGMLLANKLNVPFVLIRKAGKLPYQTISQEYALEYGTAKIEVHKDAIKQGWNVLVHDDLLATGGTAEATAQLIKQLGAHVSGFCFVVGLNFLNGKQKLHIHSNNIICLAQY